LLPTGPTALPQVTGRFVLRWLRYEYTSGKLDRLLAADTQWG
jgi:hypothetical protein